MISGPFSIVILRVSELLERIVFLFQGQPTCTGPLANFCNFCKISIYPFSLK